MQEEVCTTAISFKFFKCFHQNLIMAQFKRSEKKRMGMVLDNATKSQTNLEINFGSPYEVQYDLLVVRKMTQLFF